MPGSTAAAMKQIVQCPDHEVGRKAIHRRSREQLLLASQCCEIQPINGVEASTYAAWRRCEQVKPWIPSVETPVLLLKFLGARAHAMMKVWRCVLASIRSARSRICGDCSSTSSPAMQLLGRVRGCRETCLLLGCYGANRTDESRKAIRTYPRAAASAMCWPTSRICSSTWRCRTNHSPSGSGKMRPAQGREAGQGAGAGAARRRRGARSVSTCLS